MQTPTILVVDDEPLIRFALAERLTEEGYQVIEADTAATALARSADGVDLVLLDYKLPDGDGIEVLKRLKERDPDALVILLTAHVSVELAVEAMKQGAYHYANKPFNLDEVAILVEKALETTRLRREVRALRARRPGVHFDRIVGEGPVVVAVKAPGKSRRGSTVLLTVSGTGRTSQRRCSLQQRSRLEALHEHHMLRLARSADGERAVRP
jgi:DNA-binding NtrC family response regulator